MSGSQRCPIGVESERLGPFEFMVTREYLEVHFKKSIKEKEERYFFLSFFHLKRTATINIYLLEQLIKSLIM